MIPVLPLKGNLKLEENMIKWLKWRVIQLCGPESPAAILNCVSRHSSLHLHPLAVLYLGITGGLQWVYRKNPAGNGQCFVLHGFTLYWVKA